MTLAIFAVIRGHGKVREELQPDSDATDEEKHQPNPDEADENGATSENGARSEDENRATSGDETDENGDEPDGPGDASH